MNKKGKLTLRENLIEKNSNEANIARLVYSRTSFHILVSKLQSKIKNKDDHNKLSEEERAIFITGIHQILRELNLGINWFESINYAVLKNEFRIAEPLVPFFFYTKEEVQKMGASYLQRGNVIIIPYGTNITNLITWLNSNKKALGEKLARGVKIPKLQIKKKTISLGLLVMTSRRSPKDTYNDILDRIYEDLGENKDDFDNMYNFPGPNELRNAEKAYIAANKKAFRKKQAA